jgi:selenocysteine-specific elongation factor
LNLTGATRAPIGRGDTICHEAIALTCDRFDARLEVRPGAPNDIKSYQRVRVHIGTAERMGRVMLFGRATLATLAPGQRAYCQIELTEPVLALRGDRFILRDETAQRTIAGGSVVWPASPRHKRSDPGLPARLEAFDRGDDRTIVESLAQANDELVVSLARLALVMNHTEQDVQARLDMRDDVHAFRLDADVQYALEDDCRRAKASIVERVSAWHAAHPLSTGMDLEDARAGCPKGTPARIVRMLVQELEADEVLAREGPLLRLADHRVQVPSGDQALVARIQALLERAPMAPPDLKQLAAELAVERPKLIALMRALEKQHTVVSVAPDLFFSAEVVDKVRADLVRDVSEDGMTTAAFRDRYQTSRKYAIPLLEYFDRVGLTVRVGEVRRLKRARLTEKA